MLNISQTELVKRLDLINYKSGQRVLERRHYKYFNRFLTGAAIACVVILFLPWTQNVTGNGYVTTLTPDQRPQTIQSPIPGRIEQWLVREGDFVAKGDTILRISEIKNEYFDPNLVERTGQQIDAKTMSVSSYSEKVKALNSQIAALAQERQLKLEQGRNKLMQSRLKVTTDSIDYIAAQTNLKIAETQLQRAQTLNNEGLKPMTEVEEKRLKTQETQAKLISQENKLLTSRNDIINAQIDLNRIQQEYAEKIAKARSDQFTAQSSQFDAEAQVSKLETDRTNYQMRNDLYFITAPQNGYINKAIFGGIGETFKEGEPLVNVMPADYDLAVETFVEPLDLPLIHLGEEVRVQFDGWPAIVFSGWPNVSYGTYGAKVVAVETFISDNGKYRVLLAPDENDHPWPTALRAGSGAYTIALLEDVPIWYELWRRLNGFPPNYYQPKTTKDADKKKK
ncbi:MULTISPECIES: HlyD family secretion protein [Nonlabens]|uniref:Biotin attachment protein n=1 Tax=Nonlabens ulvanivorans TaxID=906888 RepID=A0A084JXM1_NONUL|nr:biotin/lipoyl-binding protein [Nonlabens ulvanivorans]KEZ93705.1 biotin attachment protein [Nonlabens ulvanivorans]PRX14298.1 multidrug resistance efflux pump [Nonlabens ulvanivorans]GAK99433.1 RND efflux membrane fusion protein [Nonlabens ulvanivorans]